jgi:[acyl-carrier-protein] S-malonyltransferase
MLAVVFPGQGSQKPGMGKEMYETRTEAKLVFDEVSEAVGFDVAALCFNSDEETLRLTQNAQVALYTCGLASSRTLDSVPAAAAGHSVGEYAALAAAGVLSVTDGARLVRRRGELMADAGRVQPGTMAAVLGLDRDVLAAICTETAGIVVIANDNCPGQLVTSGSVDSVKAAGESAVAKGAKRVLPLNVSGAFHSPLMADAAEAFAAHVAETPFSPGNFPVYSNVTSEPETDWPSLLVEQLKSPVRWTEIIRHMLRDGIEEFVECGPGDVLKGLIKRIR